MKSSIQIGADHVTIAAAQKAIVAILSAPHADEQTKRDALQALGAVCKVQNVSISGCTFYGAK